MTEKVKFFRAKTPATSDGSINLVLILSDGSITGGSSRLSGIADGKGTVHLRTERRQPWFWSA